MHSFYVIHDCEGMDFMVSGDSMDVTLASIRHDKFVKKEVSR